MNELTLKVDCMIDNNLEDYLLSLNGVAEANINDLNEINIKYDSNLIGLKVLVMEIILFLNIFKTPSIIAFNKHSKIKPQNYKLTIYDLCCEYCLKNKIEELLFIDGIESACSDFDYEHMKDVGIFIKYNSELISMEELKNIELKFNY